MAISINLDFPIWALLKNVIYRFFYFQLKQIKGIFLYIKKQKKVNMFPKYNQLPKFCGNSLHILTVVGYPQAITFLLKT